MSRFRDPQDPLFIQLNSSAGFDWRLAPYDIALSRAHVRMLAAKSIISGEDRDSIIGALDAVEVELESGSFDFLETDEDIHMAIERRVTALIGDSGARMHTARSRNDQVVTGLSLWIRAHARAAADAAESLEGVLLALAENHLDWAFVYYSSLLQVQVQGSPVTVTVSAPEPTTTLVPTTLAPSPSLAATGSSARTLLGGAGILAGLGALLAVQGRRLRRRHQG